METTFDYLRTYGNLLGSRILETYPPLQSTKDPVAPRIATLLRKALPAQSLAITGTAKYLRKAKAARIVAECGAGKTYMALGTIHVLADRRPSTTLVMCPSHITHKWAREVLLTIPRARAFLIEDMRNGGDPSRQHGICEVKLSKGKTVYEGKRLSLAEMRRMGRKEWRKRFPGPTFFITGKDKGNWVTSGNTSISRQSLVRTWAASSIRIPALPSSTPRCRTLPRSTLPTNSRSRRH